MIVQSCTRLYMISTGVSTMYMYMRALYDHVRMTSHEFHDHLVYYRYGQKSTPPSLADTPGP